MSYSIGGAIIKSMTLTKSWGLQSASASIEAIGAGLFQPGSFVTLQIGSSVFNGIVGNCVERIGDDGKFLSITCTDNRILLMHDTVYGSFNEVEILEDDITTPGIDRFKRYVHIFPDDYDLQKKTRTKQPLTAFEILQKLFAANGLNYHWSFFSHSRLQKPVFGVDAKQGKKLGNVVQEILENLGLMMTLSGPFTLDFAVKGDGAVPLPAIGVNAKNISDGAALGPDTRVRIVGDRNVYQTLPVDLEPDWNRAYEAFWFEPAWIAEVKARFEITDDGLAKAKATEVTIREYCAVVGIGMADYGRWGEVSRMEIPAWIYISDIVFKAYRVPRGYMINGVDLDSLELRDGLIAPVESTSDGEITYKTDEYYPDTKAYCIARGQPLNRFDPKFLKSFTVDDLTAARTKWQPVNKFNIDTKNKTIIFEDIVFVDGAGAGALYIFPNKDKTGITDDLKKLAVPNAAVQVAPAAVRAALCFEAEIFAKWYGSGTRSNAVYIPNLNVHGLLKEGVWQREILYVSGKSADQIAQEAADSALTGQNFLQSGGFTRIGSAGMALNGAIDRITVSLQFTGGGEGDGISEQIDYAKERSPIHFEAERELERRGKVPDAVKQLREQRDIAAQWRFIADSKQSLKRQTDRSHGSLNSVMQTAIGAPHGGTQTFSSPDQWLAGQPVFVLPDGTPDPNGKIFRGIVIADLATGPAIATATQGTVPVRVKGPFESGDNVGIDTGPGQVAKKDGLLPLGKVNASYSGSEVITVPVRLGAGSGAAASRFPWQVTVDGNATDGYFAHVRPGSINGLVPENIFDSFLVGEGLSLAKLRIDTDGKAATGAEVVVSATAVDPATQVAENVAPPALWDTLALIVGTAGTGGDVSFAVYQVRFTNLAITPVIALLATRTPTAPGDEPFTRWWKWQMVSS
jgi:hypothetical protein